MFSIFPDRTGTIFFSVLQKILSILFSSGFVVATFLFLRNFLPARYSLFGAALVAFEPHVIENATLGVTEPLYLFLSALGLWLGTKHTKKKILGILCTILGSMVRLDGLFVLSGIILYQISKRKKILILTVMAPLVFFVILQIPLYDHTNIISLKVNHEIIVLKEYFGDSVTLGIKKLGNSVLYLGWSTWPSFLILIPFGIISLYIKSKRHLALFLGMIVFMSGSGILAYLRAYDTRYFMHLYPMFALVSSYGLKLILDRFGQKAVCLLHTKKYQWGLALGASVIIGVSGSVYLIHYNQTHYSFADEYGQIFPTDSVVVVYPTFTLSAYEKGGYYTYYKNLCDEICLTVYDKFNDLTKHDFTQYGYPTFQKLGYHIITDRQVDDDPRIIYQYKTVILLHNEYVTQREFDTITAHPNVIYLYPNALYAQVDRDSMNNLVLVRGHNYPTKDIANGFGWKYDNSALEYAECENWNFTRIPDNGWQLNCYPENIINTNEALFQDIANLIRK